MLNLATVSINISILIKTLTYYYMYWQQIKHYNLTLKEPGHMRTSENLVGPAESILHWSGGPVGRKC